MSEFGIDAHSQSTAANWFAKKDDGWTPDGDGAAYLGYNPMGAIDVTATGDPSTVSTKKASVFGC
jgi:hypothetical protein